MLPVGGQSILLGAPGPSTSKCTWYGPLEGVAGASGEPRASTHKSQQYTPQGPPVHGKRAFCLCVSNGNYCNWAVNTVV